MFNSQIKDIELIFRTINYQEIQLSLDMACDLLFDALQSNHPVLICGNGGFASDPQNIASELVGKFLKERRVLNVRALTVDTSLITARANDIHYEAVFSRQIEAYAQPGGVLWAISTSGYSKNVTLPAKRAKELGMKVISLTGMNGGSIAPFSDVTFFVPLTSTPRIQKCM